MFERFTERARFVVTLAQEEARRFGHGHTGTEHLLLGLLREEEGLAAHALAQAGITVEHVRDEVALLTHPRDLGDEQIPWTPRCKKVLELSLREALGLGHNYIGTEHLLLGLVRENEGVAMRILTEKGATAEGLRNEIIRMLSGPGRKRAEADPSLKDVLDQAGKLLDALVKALDNDLTWRSRRSQAAIALDQLSATAQRAARYLRGMK